MSELKLYQQNKAAWVLYLMHKWLKEDRFKPVLAMMLDAVTDEEKEGARQAWKDYGRFK